MLFDFTAVTNPQYSAADNSSIDCMATWIIKDGIPAQAAVAAVPAVPPTLAVFDAEGNLVSPGSPGAPAVDAIPAVAAVPPVLEGPHPFTAHVNDPEVHSASLYADLVAGKWGPIAAYVAPSPTVPQAISDRQFAQQARNQGLITQAEAVAFVSSGAIPASLQAIINALPTQQAKDDAELTIAGATTFERTNPLTIALGVAFAQAQGVTDPNAFLDTFYIAAAAL